MSTIALFSSNSLYASALNIAQSSNAQTTGNQQTVSNQQATGTSQDTVKLSAEAEAKLLYHQGQNVNTIAASLGTTSKTVDDYLGLTLEKEIEQTLQSTLKAKS